MTPEEHTTWGRVDENGTVFVIDEGSEREVGQYPDGTAAEALAYFERKFQDLSAKVTLVEQRLHRGAQASEVALSLQKLKETLVTPNAVGDLAQLRSRLEIVENKIDTISSTQREEQHQLTEQHIGEMKNIVSNAEKLAAQDPQKIQWKSVTQELDKLFASWQELQHSGVKVPKNQAEELWKRFRTARFTLEQHRRHFFHELDVEHKAAKTVKEQLVSQAQAIEADHADAVRDYLKLVEEWKKSGRAGKKVDDALWSQFKDIGDQLFQKKTIRDQVTNEEFSLNLKAKEELIESYSWVLTETDPKKARAAVIEFQKKCELIGKVPKSHIKIVEDKIRKIEASVKKLEEHDWKRNNPETKARVAGASEQLTNTIIKLEKTLELARQSGNQKAVSEAQEALDTRKAWLSALSG